MATSRAGKYGMQTDDILHDQPTFAGLGQSVGWVNEFAGGAVGSPAV